eukprot:gene16808-19970_t
MSVEYIRLIKLIARSFYSGEVPPRPPASSGRCSGIDKVDRRGLAVLIIDALARDKRSWVKEEDLADVLKLHPKQLRRTLRVLVDEQIVRREELREKAPPKPEKPEDGAVVQESRPHLYAYCCIDYGKATDVTRLRLHLMRKALQETVEDSKAEQLLICPKCGKTWALKQLVYPTFLRA